MTVNVTVNQELILVLFDFFDINISVCIFTDY